MFSYGVCTQYSDTISFPVPAISPAWLLFCLRAQIDSTSAYIHPRTDSCCGTPISAVGAARVFMLFVSIQRRSFVCQQRLEALNEHPLPLFWARQHGRGEGHRLRLWIRNGSSAWLAGPQTTSFKAKNRYKTVFARPFFRMTVWGIHQTC